MEGADPSDEAEEGMMPVRPNRPWTEIPEGFDYANGDGRKLTVAAWKAMGITPVIFGSFGTADALSAELFLPAGSYGPAFLLFDNFYVIKRYNNADSYALAIGLLADRLAGRPEMTRAWPTEIQMLTQQQARVQGLALDLSDGGPDEDDKDFKEYGG